MSPTLCVFGILPGLAKERFALSEVVRGKAIDDATIDVHRYKCKRKIEFFKPYKGPMPAEREDLNKLKLADEVLVFRQKNETCESPLRFLNKNSETARVAFPHGRQILRSVAVKLIKGNSDNVIMNATEAGNHMDFSVAREKELK